jgi:integrase/recombinase XerC
MDDELIEEHLRFLRRSGARKETIKHRRDNIRRLSRALRIPLLEATSNDLDRWQDALVVSLSSIQTYTGHVRAFYRWAHETKRREDNPALQLPMPSIPRRLPHPIPEKDLKLAFRCADLEMQSWLGFSGWCGLRCFEIAGLNDQSLIDDEDGMLLRFEGKGGKERIVPVPEDLRPLVRAVAKRGRWFRTPTGLPANGNYVSAKSSAFFASIGLPYTLHWCRHRFGTEHYRICKDIRATQELLGHASPATTALYVQVAQRGMNKGMNQLGKSLPIPRRRRTDLGAPPTDELGDTPPPSGRRSA